MDTVKRFLKYAIWLVLFIIFSEFLINVGLNSTYNPIKRRDNIEQVHIYQAEATLVNGRIRGLITNSQDNELSGKYLEVDFYSERDVYLGKKYIDIGQLQPDGTQAFEILFKQKDVASYEVKIVDQKEDGGEIEIIPDEWTKPEIIVATFFTLLILW